MERQEILAIMDELKLAGMRAAFDEVLANGLKRQLTGGLFAHVIGRERIREDWLAERAGFELGTNSRKAPIFRYPPRPEMFATGISMRVS